MSKIRFPIWRANVKIGMFPIETLVCKARDNLVEINEWGQEIFSKIEKVPEPISIDLVKIWLRAKNGLPRKSKLKSTRPMFEEAFEAGYCLCPPETALYLFIDPRRKLLGSFELGMRPVPCVSRASSTGFQDNLLTIEDHKHRFGHSQCIGANHASLDSFAEGVYVLCKATPELIALGYNKL